MRRREVDGIRPGQETRGQEGTRKHLEHLQNPVCCLREQMEPPLDASATAEVSAMDVE